jgi:hypothetical protein
MALTGEPYAAGRRSVIKYYKTVRYSASTSDVAKVYRLLARSVMPDMAKLNQAFARSVMPDMAKLNQAFARSVMPDMAKLNQAFARSVMPDMARQTRTTSGLSAYLAPTVLPSFS